MGRSGRHSAEADEYRKLYGRKEWKALREQHLSHHPLCVYCLQDDIVTAAEVVDHIDPHHGRLDLFFDPANLQSLCKLHHDRTKRLEELGHTVIRFGPDGFPL